MTTRRRESTVFKELGMALTVLALWMLSLLVPLHQTSGVLRELARAGYDISNGWTVCVTLAQDESRPDQAPAMCPVQVMAKIAPLDFDLSGLPALREVEPLLADWTHSDPLSHVARPERAAQPRGPPALI